MLSAQVRPRHSGRADAWITFMGYPGEKPVLDASLIPHSSLVRNGLDNGAFQIEGVSYVRAVNLTIMNSHDAGLTVRDASNVELINNETRGSFSSGIAVWDTDHGGTTTQHIRVLGNTIVRATAWDLAAPNMSRGGGGPHEAISIGGAVDFEVAYNHVYDSAPEGIDIKETSKRGKVHHNLIHNVGRQGLYVDAWFGEIRDIEIYSNVIHNCHGAGLVLSVENGDAVGNVYIHNNLIFDNDGSGMLFSRWGANNVRRNVTIANNVIYHNGYGEPKKDQTYYWITGGLYLYSTNVHDISVTDNIFSANRGFQIGYSELFLRGSASWPAIAREKNIQIAHNVIDGKNTIESPIMSGGDLVDRLKIYATNGQQAILGSSMFMDAANQDFTIGPGSPAAANHILAGTIPPEGLSKLWWKQDFPPTLTIAHFDQR